jgi:hypothetical protein
MSGLHEERLAWATRLLALDPINLTGLLATLDVLGLEQRLSEAGVIQARLRSVYPALSAADVDQIFRKYRRADHRAVFDDYMKRLPLSK